MLLLAPSLVILFIVVSIAYANNAAFDIQKEEDLNYARSMFELVAMPLFWIYYTCFECSRYQGTPGKILLGLRVADMDGKRIGFWQAAARFLVKNVTLVLFGGFIFAMFTERRQALHDLVARTVVIVKQ